MLLHYNTIREIIDAATEAGVKISEFVLKEQAEALEQTEEEIYARMEKSFDVMCEATEKGQDKDLRSMSGLTGGEGWKMKEYSDNADGGICGTFMTRAMSFAVV